MILVLLQNPYRERGVDRYNDREFWLGRMWSSYTGKRLKEMLPEDMNIWVDNASWNWGEESSACFPADLVHIKNLVSKLEPEKILACGRIAQEGLRKLNIEYIPAPHPAYRALSKKMTAEIRSKL